MKLWTPFAHLVLFTGTAAKIAFTHVPGNTVQVGTPFTLEWDGADNSLPVTLTLKKGDANNLETIASITSNGQNGRYVWIPATSLPPSNDYAIEISQGVDEINYSELFSIISASSSASSSGGTTSGTTTHGGSPTSSTTSTSQTSSAVNTSTAATTKASTATATSVAKASATTPITVPAQTSVASGLSAEAKLGLGVGIGLGIPILAITAFVIVLLRRRRRHRWQEPSLDSDAHLTPQGRMAADKEKEEQNDAQYVIHQQQQPVLQQLPETRAPQGMQWALVPQEGRAPPPY